MNLRAALLSLLFCAPSSAHVPDAPLQLPPAAPAPESPFLGLQTEAKDPKNPKGGVVVVYVWPVSAAQTMGFQVGDEVLMLNDVVITDPESFTTEIRKENVNAKLRFRIRRAGQEKSIDGRIGSREKTMREYQELVRKELIGKPLAPLPAVEWWSASTRRWDGKGNDDGMASRKDKLTVVMSFDDCEVCKSRRYLRLNQMKALFTKVAGAENVAYVGLYFDSNRGKPGKDDSEKAATALLAANPPVVPIGLVHYPSGKPTAEDRGRQVIIHNHGTAILDPSGNVEYVQVTDPPGQEFSEALQRAFIKHASPAGDGKSEQRKPGSP
jgi:hypothetical protein